VKPLIRNILQNLNSFMLFIMLSAFVFMMLTFETQLSFDKIDNLNKQNSILKELANLDTDDKELALITLNEKTAQLQNDILKLSQMYKYNFTQKYIIDNQKEYLSDLDTLTILTNNFIKDARFYYQNEKKGDTLSLQMSLQRTSKHINLLIQKSIQYSEDKFNFYKYFSIVFFFIIVILTYWYRNRITHIYKDISYLSSIDKAHKPYKIYSQEMDSIFLRMKRKQVFEKDPSMIDKVTGINNRRGLLSSFTEKKDRDIHNVTSVTIYEIDNFSKSNRPYTQELIQSILRKLAHTISLYEKATDIIARTEYNQFTIILSRASVEQAFRDNEIIRESISELNFNLKDKKNITLTGGFFIKPMNTNLEEALKQANKILSYAKKQGTNQTLQLKDIAK